MKKALIFLAFIYAPAMFIIASGAIILTAQ